MSEVLKGQESVRNLARLFCLRICHQVSDFSKVGGGDGAIIINSRFNLAEKFASKIAHVVVHSPHFLYGCWLGINISIPYYVGCSLRGNLTYFRAENSRAREREEGQLKAEAVILYNGILKVAYYHFAVYYQSPSLILACCGKGQHRGMNTRKQGSIGKHLGG